MDKKAFQDYYPDEFAHCYGCGRLNQDGLQIKSYWDGEESRLPLHTAALLLGGRARIRLRRDHCLAHRLSRRRHGIGGEIA